jgi:hypothetical protein
VHTDFDTVLPAGSDLMPVPTVDGFGDAIYWDDSREEAEELAATVAQTFQGVDPANVVKVEAEMLYDLIVNGSTQPTEALLAHAREFAAQGIEPLATYFSSTAKEEPQAGSALAARVDAVLATGLPDGDATPLDPESIDADPEGDDDHWLEPEPPDARDEVWTPAPEPACVEAPKPPDGFDPAIIRPS